MFKKTLCLFCALTMLFTVAGCGDKNPSTDVSSDLDIGGFMQFEGEESTSGSSTERTTGGNNEVSGKAVIQQPDTPTNKKSVLASKDYKGKSFSFLYWYSPNNDVAKKVEAFNKEHNANLKIDIVSGDISVSIAKSIASGKPYDVIANHSLFFPQSIFDNIYEPLESYISKEDMYDSSKPKDGGLSKYVNQRFAYNGHYYALGSHKSTYQVVYYYNKKLFKDAGFEDPWELYKKGEWTWDKIKEYGAQIYDEAEGIAMCTALDSSWGSINNVRSIVFDKDRYVENVTDANYVQSVQLYNQLFNGNNPIMIKGTSESTFISGKAYMHCNVTDSWRQISNNAKVSNAFGRKIENLGVVPVPYGPLNTSKAYPANPGQGYSAAKGCKDPSVAACYALFESKYTVPSSKNDFPADVLTEVQTLFSKNASMGYGGFQNSSGTYAYQIESAAWKEILNGADIVATLNNLRQPIQRCIDDSTTHN